MRPGSRTGWPWWPRRLEGGRPRRADRAKWAEATERGIAAARRARDPKVLVDLLLSDAMRLEWLEAKYDASLERSREAAKLAEESGYEERLGGSYLLFGFVYDDQGKYAEALDWYGKALAIWEKVLGRQHPDTARTYNGIAIVYGRQGKYAEALEWYGKALAIQEKVLGRQHPSTARTWNNIGQLCTEKAYEPACAFQRQHPR